ncbi:unnamed protein product [Meganyctiphanes norvegica]|uniref:Uncharacterized protein n=1 Tax=Meganyctiphanes norvegica TaxID=48144 RepID=A0AAV2QUM4_MEGNR
MKHILAVVALLSMGALSRAQIIHPYECHCGVFVSYPAGVSEVYRMEPLHLEGCDDASLCTQACTDEWNTLTNNGDLTTELPNGYTLGQDICLSAVEHFIPFLNDEPGFVNARLCEGNWKDTGLSTRQNICCNAGHNYDCES